MIPQQRIRRVNGGTVNEQGEYVLYWMIAHRRLTWNFALQRAAEEARRLRRPLLILEALRLGYPWASDRFHRFILDGMAEHRRELGHGPVAYYPHVELEPGQSKGLLATLSRRACLVVTDNYPCFFQPRMVAAAGRQLDVLLEEVDANGILPLAAPGKIFARAHDFRRWWQQELLDHLEPWPAAAPLETLDSTPRLALDQRWTDRWPLAPATLLDGDALHLTSLPIDHGVAPAESIGGALAAQQRWQSFLRHGLSGYHERRREVDPSRTSGISPYLHFGHIAAHQLLYDILASEEWTPAQLELSAVRPGQREGWWGLSEGAEAFLDQLISWREVGFNFCWHRDDYHRYDSLPPWALTTLREHEEDERPELYTPNQLDRAETSDTLWNATQRQLVEQGTIHPYLRMVWGKKILEWSESPQQALATMTELNNRYALDGRDPNSYNGLSWILGRYDRAWGPERPIFGKIRYMSSLNTRRKLDVEEYIARFS
jgi:deoxyribodipyrimidine photo-lyase